MQTTTGPRYVTRYFNGAHFVIDTTNHNVVENCHSSAQAADEADKKNREHEQATAAKN